MTIDTGTQDPMPRARAITRLRKQHDFYRQLVVYGLVNGFLVALWIVTGADGLFWPIFLMAVWGIGVVMNAWDAYRDDEPGEARIQHEMQRLQQR